MPRITTQAPYTCARCLRARQLQNAPSIHAIRAAQRSFSRCSPLRSSQATAAKIEAEDTTVRDRHATQNAENASMPVEDKEQGAMSRRLAQATEDALLEGGRAGRKAVEEAGFSEELKARLLERIEGYTFKADNAAAFAEAELPSIAGRGTRDIATAQAWTGTEATEDVVLRMLNDAHKPLQPGLRGRNGHAAPNLDLRLQPKRKPTSGQRLSAARDKTSIYTLSKDSSMSEKEREELKASLKERFGPAVRTGVMPTSFRGLEGLANERIEDAIARGQFKNIPRGPSVVTDNRRASNPFVDTTEYLLNNIIKRQDIVPPWIEKQQELLRAATNFRARLRFDWKRHAARTVSSRGGSLEEQVRWAEVYAQAERQQNPKVRDVETINMPSTTTEHAVMANTPRDSAAATERSSPSQISPETDDASIPVTEAIPVSETPQALPAPLRDPVWEKNESSYLALAVANLNSLTRSYNLMAPELAKKPYFSLERELRSCYADVAPQIAGEIRERARAPRGGLGEAKGRAGQGGGVLDRLAGERARVYDERKPQYGFREFVSELFWRKGG